ncbi:MAG: hypothetical protein RSC02_02310 [Malacoplasma sp.]
MAKPKSDEAINFDSVIKNLSSDTKASDTPWFKKKSSIIAMSSTLGVGALATVIAVPIALTSGSATTITPSTQGEIDAAVVSFNQKPNSDKISLYNSIVNDKANINKIRDYMFKENGMKKFFDANVKPVTSEPSGGSGVLETFNKFKSYLFGSSQRTPYSISTGFLSIKGQIQSNQTVIAGQELFSNINANSSNCVYVIPKNTTDNTHTTKDVVYTFYSLVASTITNITLNKDANNVFSMTITLPTVMNNNLKNYNFAFELDDIRTTVNINSQRYGSLPIEYKPRVTLDNSTLFPDMSNYVKTSILGLR